MDWPMPILLILLLAVLIAQIGFWDTFGAVLSAVGVIILFLLVAAAAVAVAGYMVVRRFR